MKKYLILDFGGVIRNTVEVKDIINNFTGNKEKLLYYLTNLNVLETKNKNEFYKHIEEIKKECNITENTNIFLNNWLKFRTANLKINNELLNKVKELLKENKIDKICILSDIDYYYSRHIGFDTTLFNTFFSCDIGAIKISGIPFEYAMKKLGYSNKDIATKNFKNKILFIDDSIEKIIQAQNCGWDTYKYQFDIDNLQELFNKINNWVKQ